MDFHLQAQRASGTARLQGRIIDEDGKPVVGAIITVRSIDIRNKIIEGFNKTAKSNRKGIWKMFGMGSGWCRIEISAPGYELKTDKIKISQVYENYQLNFKLTKTEQSSADNVELPGFDEEGHKLYNEGKYEEAMASYKLFLRENPDAFEIHYVIGNCYKMLNKPDLAQTEYEKVIQESNPDLSPSTTKIQAAASTELGNIYLERDSKEIALKYFIKSLEFNSQNETLAYNVGEMYFSSGKIEEAIRYFTLASEVKPSWPDPYLKLGYAYLNKEQSSKAKESFEKVLELDPDHPQANSIKEILERLGKKN